MTRRLLVAAVVMSVPVALWAWAPWHRGLPEVERGVAACPSSGGPLVPGVRYRMVQLCPVTGGRAAFRMLDDDMSRRIVERVNASETPTAGCEPVDLVLRAGSTRSVVRIDSGTCGAARPGAADLHRFVADLIGG